MPADKVVSVQDINRESIVPVLAQWQSHKPGMGVLAFLPEGEAGELATLQGIFRDASVPLIGAIFPALIDGATFQEHGVILIRLDEMPFYLLRGEIDGGEASLEDTSEVIAGELAQHIATPSESTTLFLLFDAMLPHIAQILESLYLNLADQVHYMGVNAGSESFQPMPCLFDREQIVQNGVLAILLPQHEGAFLEHGYKVPDQLVAATSTEGNRIISIDWRPAFEVYRERVQAQYGVEITTENFYQYSVHFPFGIIRADDEVLIRIPVALQEDGSLFCVGEIPANSVLTLLEAPKADTDHTPELLAAHFSGMDGNTPLLSFYCAGRRLHLGVESAQNELHSLSNKLGTTTLFGALSLGEIGSSRRGGYPLFHNAALVVSQV